MSCFSKVIRLRWVSPLSLLYGVKTRKGRVGIDNLSLFWGLSSGGFFSRELKFLKTKGSHNMADFLCLPRHRARLSLANANRGSVINVPLTAG